MTNDKLQIDAGGLLGAFVGAYLCAHVGIVSRIVYTVATGDYKDIKKNVHNLTITGLVVGACAGAFVPL